MKKFIYVAAFFSVWLLALAGCKNDELTPAPEVPYTIELNKTVFHNGDSLYGRVIVNENELAEGMKIKKIDCRLGNIVIGTTKNAMVCPFGVRLEDKPIGEHTFSVIFKCDASDCDETYWRYDIKMITINE